MVREHSQFEMESSDSQVRRTIAQARLAAPADVPVLIRGEKGTGKRTLARCMHAWSQRFREPFVAVNCAGLGPELRVTELIQEAQGRFADTTNGKRAAAAGGTLFFDEVGALPSDLQSELLDLIHERQDPTNGDALNLPASFRVLTTTSVDLESKVHSGAFHQELHYRLSLIELTLPPLRLRSDISALAHHFLAFFSLQTGNHLAGFTPEAREALAQHHWPGNICELRNAIERVAILAPGPDVTLADLPDQIARALARTDEAIEVGRRVSLEALEDEHVRRVLRTSSSLEEAAQVLNINPSTLYRKRKRLGL